MGSPDPLGFDQMVATLWENAPEAPIKVLMPSQHVLMVLGHLRHGKRVDDEA
jgi:hypothetical protein